MQLLINFISKPWVGSTLGVLGLCAAVVFYIRSRRISRLGYQNDGLTVVGGSRAAFPKEVSISFAGEPVECVTATRYVIWNAGNTTLDGANIVEADPMRFELDGDGQILKFEVLKTTRKVNAFNVFRRDNNTSVLDVRFDYLDPGDGIAVEILHSGNRNDLSLQGTIRGLSSGIKNYGRAGWYLDKRMTLVPFPLRIPFRIISWIAVILGALITLFGLLRPTLYEWFPKLFEKTPDDPTKPLWAAVIGGLIYAALPLFALWLRRRRYPSALEPAHEEEAEQDSSPDRCSAALHTGR